MQDSDAYPVVVEISDHAREAIAKEAEKTAKNFRNLAKLRVDQLPGNEVSETILDETTGQLVTKKRRMSKQDWAIGWHGALNAQASRMEHLKDQMLRTYEIGEEHEQEAKDEQVGETRAPSQVAQARVSASRANISRRAIAEASRKAREGLRKQTA